VAVIDKELLDLRRRGWNQKITVVMSFVSPNFLLPFKVFLAGFLRATFTFFFSAIVISSRLGLGLASPLTNALGTRQRLLTPEGNQPFPHA
jgi:hypothetical protein